MADSNGTVATRGDVWWVELPEPIGAALGGRRPAVVLQADYLNRSTIGTILIVPCTGNLSRAASPGNVLLPKKATGLKEDTIANVTQLVAADRWQLDQRLRRLPPGLLGQIEEGVRLVLDL